MRLKKQSATFAADCRFVIPIVIPKNQGFGLKLILYAFPSDGRETAKPKEI